MYVLVDILSTVTFILSVNSETETLLYQPQTYMYQSQ